MQSKATILGIKREPAAGYDVNGRSFILNVDGSDKTISFSYGGNLPLSIVISQINSAVGSTVAFNDNGFLKLQSPTAGGSSYLKVKVDASSTPTNVLVNLGLFASIESYAGDLTPAQHVDPDRQVATPNQMTMAEGENFEARVFNRAIAQLSINNDRSEGLLSKKRVAIRDVFNYGTYAPGATPGIQVTGSKLMYVGKAGSPSIDTLEKYFGVLDSDNREMSKDVYLVGSIGYTGQFYTTTDGTNRQYIDTYVFPSFYTEVTAEKGNYYITSNSFTGAATALNGKLLKILEITPGSPSKVYIENIDPATGQRVTITDFNIAITVIYRNRSKVVVDGIYANVTDAAASANRLENVRVSKRTSVVPTRIELGNRIVCVGQDFGAAPVVQIGDIVTWASSTINSPFNNNGDYRVDKIIDKETLQVVASDWSAALLNPNMTGGSVGVINITTDGEFVVDPFIRFANQPQFYALPATGETVNLAYLRGTTIRDALADSSALFQDDVRFTQEADETMQRAICRMWGPSVSSVDDVLYADYRLNIESLQARLNWEHYNYDDTEKTGSSATDTLSWGRHKDIRPDTINMWYWAPSDLSTPRVTLRGFGRYSKSYNAGTTYTDRMDSLLQVKDTTGVVTLQINSLGSINNVQDQDIGLGVDNRVWMDMLFNNPSADSGSGGGLPTLGDYYTSGERIIQRFRHKWYNSVDSAGGMSLIGMDYSTNLELTSTSNQKFDAIIGQRIHHESTSNHILGATVLKWLELGGTLNKSAVSRGDGEDRYMDVYGIHLNYTFGSSYSNNKIWNGHYGIKIEDIQYGRLYNYAIKTGKGKIEFGDGVYIIPVDPSSLPNGAMLNVNASVSDAAVSMGSMGVLAGHIASTRTTANWIYGADFSLSDAGAPAGATTSMWGMRVAFSSNTTRSVTNMIGMDVSQYYGSFQGGADPTNWYGVYIRGCSASTTKTVGVEIGDMLSNTSAAQYGIKIGTIANATSNYAIYTGPGLVRFGDNVTVTGNISTTDLTTTGNINAGTSLLVAKSYSFVSQTNSSNINEWVGTFTCYPAYSSYTSGGKTALTANVFPQAAAGGSLTTMTGIMSYHNSSYSGTSVSCSNVYLYDTAFSSFTSTKTYTNVVGYHWAGQTITAPSVVTNLYGIKIEDVSGGTNNYAIYTGLGNVRCGGEIFFPAAVDAQPATTASLTINTSTGQLGITAPSSIRFKKEIVDMDDDSSWIYQLRPVTFEYKNEGKNYGEGRNYGVIAEEVLKIAPDFVYYGKSSEVPDDYVPEAWDRVESNECGKKFRKQILGVHYDRLVPLLLNELKKLKETVDGLKALVPQPS